MRKIINVALTLTLLLGLGPQISASEELAENSDSAILIEVATGRVLYEKNADQQLEPASMTKMMAMYLVLEAIHTGHLEWEQILTVSEHAAGLGGAQIYLEPGEEMSVHDLFLSVAISSANDSITALAEAVSGTEAEFVTLMNERAQDFGMTNTHFANPTGLPDEGGESTARDMAILAQRLVLDFPEVTEFTSIYEDYVREDLEEPFWLVNTNKLVRYVDGLDGLKTGYTSEADYCLTATAQRGDMRVVAVVMGADRSDIRNREIAQLIEYAFARYEFHPRIEAGEVVSTGENVLADGRRFEVVTMDAIHLLQEVGGYLGEEHHEVVINPDLVFPLEPGDVVGKLVYFLDGEPYQQVNLTVTETVEKTSFISLWMHMLGNLFFGR